MAGDPWAAIAQQHEALTALRESLELERHHRKGLECWIRWGFIGFGFLLLTSIVVTPLISDYLLGRRLEGYVRLAGAVRVVPADIVLQEAMQVIRDLPAGEGIWGRSGLPDIRVVRRRLGYSISAVTRNYAVERLRGEGWEPPMP